MSADSAHISADPGRAPHTVRPPHHQPPHVKSGLQHRPYAEPTLADLLVDLWHVRVWLLVGAFIGAVCAFIFISSAIPQYKTSMIIGPAERHSSTDFKALLPENSGFAVQYLVDSFGKADSSDFIRFENILREQSVAAALHADAASRNIIQADRSFSFSAVPATDSAADIALYLQQGLNIEPVGSSPLKKVILYHPDAEDAVALLRQLVLIADNLIKADAQDSARKRTAYLKEELSTALHPDHRQALTTLLMKQEHLQMILAMEEPFAAVMVEPPSASARPVWPRTSLYVSVILLISVMLAYLASLVYRQLSVAHDETPDHTS